MAKPTKHALKNAWHTCSYLFGTGGYGVRLEKRKKGQSMMDFREIEEVEDAEMQRSTWWRSSQIQTMQKQG